jgi:hypothetical protein
MSLYSISLKLSPDEVFISMINYTELINELKTKNIQLQKQGKEDDKQFKENLLRIRFLNEAKIKLARDYLTYNYSIIE